MALVLSVGLTENPTPVDIEGIDGRTGGAADKVGVDIDGLIV